MELRCLKCKHRWNYKGDSNYYVTCPRCYNKINVTKSKVGEEQDGESKI